MVLPNFEYRVLLALKYYGNDAQARTSLLKQDPEPVDWSQYSVPGHGPGGKVDFAYSNNRNDKERCEAARRRWAKRNGG